jgi:RPA family protein
MEQNKFERHTAVKTIIKELLTGEYIQEKENNPNYLLSSSKEKIYRLNVMGIILTKEILGSVVNILIDDGTGQINLRFFEENKIIDSLNIGDAILVIGRLRTYNQERYVSSEIIKRINPLWLRLRSLELKELINKKEEVVVEKESIVAITNEIKETKENIVEAITEKEIVKDKKEIVEKDDNEEEINDDIEEDILLPIEKIKKIIEEMDTGDGVLIEEIISNSPLNDTEEVIEKMLENGDIFQNLPGKVKVL